MTKAGGNWLQAAFLTTEEEEIEEVTASLAAAKEIGVDVALEAVLSELDDILSLTKNDTDGFCRFHVFSLEFCIFLNFYH